MVQSCIVMSWPRKTKVKNENTLYFSPQFWQERFTLGVTAILTMAVLSLVVSEKVPHSSTSVPLLGQFPLLPFSSWISPTPLSLHPLYFSNKRVTEWVSEMAQSTLSKSVMTLRFYHQFAPDETCFWMRVKGKNDAWDWERDQRSFQ